MPILRQDVSSRFDCKCIGSAAGIHRGSTRARNLPFARYKTSERTKCHLACLVAARKCRNALLFIVQLHILTAFLLGRFPRIHYAPIGTLGHVAASLNCRRETRKSIVSKTGPLAIRGMQGPGPSRSSDRESRKWSARGGCIHLSSSSERQVTFSRVGGRVRR